MKEVRYWLRCCSLDLGLAQELSLLRVICGGPSILRDFMTMALLRSMTSNHDTTLEEPKKCIYVNAKTGWICWILNLVDCSQMNGPESSFE